MEAHRGACVLQRGRVCRSVCRTWPAQPDRGRCCRARSVPLWPGWCGTLRVAPRGWVLQQRRGWVYMSS